ncbi:MAG: diadenylate cyclase [Coriobacteriia bacterium]|nr:diadenylate cyclase [Coriobacteriia bacterium]
MANTGEVVWGWQHDFRIGVKVLADLLMERLDARLQPYVFLLALGRSADGQETIVVDPDDCWYTWDQFAGFYERAEVIRESDPANQTLHSHPLEQQRHAESIRADSVRSAALEILGALSSPDRTSFASAPVKVRGFDVLVVLQLDRAVVESYYSLQNSQFDDYWRVAVSLIDSAVAEYFAACQVGLHTDREGYGPFEVSASPDALLRAAGHRLMLTPGWQLGLAQRLFNDCTSLAGQRLEGEASTGRMILARQGRDDLEEVVRFERPVRMSVTRAARKALEMTDDSTLVQCEGDVITRLVHVAPGFDWGAEDAFIVEYTGHQAWQLTHDSNVLMRVVSGLPSLPRPRVDRARFADVARRVLGSTEPQVEAMWVVVSAAIEQRHGTMVVFANDAESEASRLAGQALPVQPTPLSPETVRLVTGIDGAVLCDGNAECHAVGVILDGLATEACTPARGARFNSAARYCLPTGCRVAVVVSEDGDVDVLPALLPQMRVALIHSIVGDLRIAVNAEPLDVRAMNRALSWLDERRPYIESPEAAEINSLLELANSRQDPYAISWVRSPFTGASDLRGDLLLR